MFHLALPHGRKLAALLHETEHQALLEPSQLGRPRFLYLVSPLVPE